MNCFLKFKKKARANETESADPCNTGLELGISQGGYSVSTENQPNLRVFSLAEVKKATENFSASFMLAKGESSTVYKGTIKLHHGAGNPTVVAIKRLEQQRQAHNAHNECPEVHLLGGVDHPNLLKLIGICSVEGKHMIQRLLVYEYMPNHGLDNYLFGKNLAGLSWETRLQIMLGAAQGLAYLHAGLEVPIIHRNFKPSHVLLDNNFRAKLSGFGLAKQGPGDFESHVSTRVAGTMGYADPQYLMTGRLTLKSDIYSYGVVLYEVLTGRRVRDRLGPFQEWGILEWVKRNPAKGKRFYRILDPRLHKDYSRSAAVKVAKLADRCISMNPEDRPDMGEIVAALRDAILESCKCGEELHFDSSIPRLHSPSSESCFDADVGDSIATLKETLSESDMARGESLSDLSIRRLHSPPSKAYSDPDVDRSIVALKETVSEFDMDLGESLSDSSELHSPLSPSKIIQHSARTPSVFGPVWKECQPRPHALPAAEHRRQAGPIGLDNRGADYSVSEHRLGKRVLELDKEVDCKRILFLFGEGYEFEKEMLIQLWMALGFLKGEPMEVIGAYCFENLVSEGYILCSVANSLYKVNSEKLSTKLNMSREKQDYIKLVNGSRNNDTSTTTLHASVVCDEINASIFQTLAGFKRLRTLLFLGNYGSRLEQVPRDLFLCYESLEALDLSGTHIKELPSSAGKMINLRYLDLSWTFIEALPERIDRFRKLQTLKLEGCSRLRRLPNEMKGLIDLRHLHLDVLRQLAAFPEGLGALVNIRTLSAFPVGTEEGLKISELKYLNNIAGSFCIAKIENVQDADEAKEASLTTKRNIKKLKLRWSKYKADQPMKEDESILENLCPDSGVEEVQILCYPGSKLPDWIVDISFDKLVSITLFGCVRVAVLPSLGKLPSLASLELISLNGVTTMDFKGEEDCIAFPKLQKLALDGMLNLQTWLGAREGDYPCLVELSIKDCPKLFRFPSIVYVPVLKQLDVSGCTNLALVSDEKLSTSLHQLIVEDCPLIQERCCKDGGQDWHKIQHVPTIWINQVAIQTHECGIIF